MNKKSLQITVTAGILVLILAVVVSVAAAQGNGNGNGNGNQNQQGQSAANGTQSRWGQQEGIWQGYDACAHGGSFSQNRAMNGQGKNATGMRGQMRQQLADTWGYGVCLDGLPDAVEGELSDEVIAALTDGIMDEYNAYNTYQVVINQFGPLIPFSRIQQSEAQHIAALETLFNRYGLDVPEATAIDETLTFDSLSAACEIAAQAEINNFDLYDEMLETVADYPDMVQVMTQLRDASEYRHLPAFERCAAR